MVRCYALCICLLIRCFKSFDAISQNIYDKRKNNSTNKKNDESTETKEHEVQFALWM